MTEPELNCRQYAFIVGVGMLMVAALMGCLGVGIWVGVMALL